MSDEKIYLDAYSGRYFEGSADFIDKINQKLRDGLIKTYGELYDEIGWPCPTGYEDVYLVRTDEPIFLDFRNGPRE